MGKLSERLQKQLLSPEHKKDAEECIEVYNWIKRTDKDGCVWSSRWDPLVDVTFKGYPSDKRTYKLNITGQTLLKSIKA
jgi:2-hydroxy-3-keto-5-methylthiopentenyl-1-phosphate phosphatase